VGFTGVDLARGQSSGPVMIYAVNAAGDLFAKTIVPKGDIFEDSELDQEMVETRDTAWLDAWADSVVSCSLLPEISLKCRQKQIETTPTFREWSLPVTVKSKRWRNRFRGKKVKIGGNPSQPDSKLNEDTRERSKKGMPRLSTTSWPPDIYEWYSDVEMGKNLRKEGRKSKRLKVVEAKRMLDKMGKSSSKSSLHLAPANKVYSNRTTRDVKKKFSAVLERRIGSEGGGCLYNHLVPHLEKLDLNSYMPNTSYRYSNRHSESILKIMMGEGAASKVKKTIPDSSSLPSGQPSPAPPQEEDTTFTMDAFWADLGVEAPPPPSRRGSQAKSFASSDRDVDGEWE